MNGGRLRARHYATGAMVDVAWNDGVIQDVLPARNATPQLQSGFVAPSFFDLQINGGLGHGFSSPDLTKEKIERIVAICQRHGIGSFCPTLITDDFAVLRHGFETLRRAVESDAALGRAMPVFHLEGPYISPEDGPRGAHPREHVRPPSWDEFQRLQDAAGGRIRLVTMAPEIEGALPFIEQLVRSGVIVAIGHSAASPGVIRDAIRAGARLSTHLFNGCAAMLPRHENAVFAQLAADELMASIICDGHHLPPTLIRTIVRVKSPSRLILTCDASSLAGLPPGRYHEWGQEIDIESDGKIVVPSQGVLAGSWHFTDTCVGNVMRHGDVSLLDSVRMAAENPRRLLGLPIPRLEPGMPADMVLFDVDDQRNLHVRHSIIDGGLVSASNG